jgi:dTDP-4-amino-4,6-dideoxygalactose transaminase
VRVPLLDLGAQLAPVREELLDAVASVIDSGRFVLGPKVLAFEAAVAERLDVPHAIGVSSGSDALWIALAACGVQSGDRVATTAFSFHATAGSIVRLGARPVFIDLDPRTLALSPDELERWIDRHPDSPLRAIVAVHLFGRAADLERLSRIADRIGAPLIEDAAQAFGTTDRGRSAGTAGRAGCFSFYPSKTLGGLGDGGMIVTRDAEVADRCRRLRNHGAGADGIVRVAGGNFRLDEIQAAALSVLLPRVDGWIAARRANAARYDRALGELGELGLELPAPDAGHAYAQYVIGAEQRDDLARALAAREIGTEVYYRHPLSSQPAYGPPVDCPEAAKASRTKLAIPVHPSLSLEAVDHVIEAVTSFMARS